MHIFSAQQISEPWLAYKSSQSQTTKKIIIIGDWPGITPSGNKTSRPLSWLKTEVTKWESHHWLSYSKRNRCDMQGICIWGWNYRGSEWFRDNMQCSVKGSLGAGETFWPCRDTKSTGGWYILKTRAVDKH